MRNERAPPATIVSAGTRGADEFRQTNYSPWVRYASVKFEPSDDSSFTNFRIFGPPETSVLSSNASRPFVTRSRRSNYLRRSTSTATDVFTFDCSEFGTAVDIQHAIPSRVSPTPIPLTRYRPAKHHPAPSCYPKTRLFSFIRRPFKKTKVRTGVVATGSAPGPVHGIRRIPISPRLRSPT